VYTHQYGGVILAGRRYFRVMDLWPDHSVMDTLVTTHFSDGPSLRDQVRNHPEMLIAADVAMMMSKREALTYPKKKVQAPPRKDHVSNSEVS
jgi:hypothetical protein